MGAWELPASGSAFRYWFAGWGGGGGGGPTAPPPPLLAATRCRRAQEKSNRAASCQVANTSIRRRSSAAERLNPDPAFLTSDGPNGVGYPLITGRSQDRNLPSAKRIASSVVMRTDNGCVITGVAQGQRAGLITPRSLDRNESPVDEAVPLVLFHQFQKEKPPSGSNARFF